jgi:hypothetical protein
MGDMFRRNKNLRRKRKTGAAKVGRWKVQKARLIALGVSKAKVDKMNPVEIRTMLKHPAKLKAKAKKA